MILIRRERWNQVPCGTRQKASVSEVCKSVTDAHAFVPSALKAGRENRTGNGHYRSFWNR